MRQKKDEKERAKQAAERYAERKKHHEFLNAFSDEAMNDPRVKKAQSELSEAYKNVQDYYNLSSKEREKYLDMAADNAWKKYGDGTEASREQYRKGYRYDDLDQGYENSYSMYLKSKGIKLADDEDRRIKARDNLKRSITQSLATSLAKASSNGRETISPLIGNEPRTMEDAMRAMKNVLDDYASETVDRIHDKKKFYAPY